MTTSNGVAVSVKDIIKRFGATHALDGVSFQIAAGEFHALLGENGAGKSTLVKMLSGLLRPNSGELSVFGQRVNFENARAAHELGIRTAFQEISLVPDLSIADNLLLPRAPLHFGLVLNKREIATWVEKVLTRLELTDVDPRMDVRFCSLPIRQKLEIARALAHEPKILLLDEPTSALSTSDVEWLSRRITEARARGTTIIFITHRMAEVRRFCDRLTIVRNGREVGTFDVSEISDSEVVKLVIGRSLANAFPPRPAQPPSHDGPAALAAEELSVTGRLDKVSLALWPGEILGVAGLQGMGQYELFYSLFGAMPVDGGRIIVRGKPVHLSSPRDAVAADIGISLVPEERKTEALALSLSGRENVALPVIQRFTRFGWINRARERHSVDCMLERVQVHPRALYQPCASFSGGNQQKMVIAKWLLSENRILLLFDPTRGVDVGSKHEIYVLIREFVNVGGAVLCYSTDVLEIVNLCDRAVVMYGGRVNAELDRNHLSEETIMSAALGSAAVTSPQEQEA